MEDLDFIRAVALQGIPHGFMTRRGGISKGIYAGLNVGLGSDDDPVAVLENRRRATEAVLPGGTLITAYQIHSADVAIATATSDEDRPKVDALVTDRPGYLLGIVTADCVPVLFADLSTQVVGAAHAGWKGALGGVTDSTIEAMEGLGADRANIVAAIGPCIGRTSYEVDAGFRDRFLASDEANEMFFIDGPRADHPHFDIAAYVASRLASAGIGRIETIDLDTYSHEDRFFSFRRTTHRKEPDYGRQFSLIGLPV